MNTWILIITVFYAGESTKVTYIEGFTKEACTAAAEFWNSHLHQDRGYLDKSGFAICVDKGVK